MRFIVTPKSFCIILIVDVSFCFINVSDFKLQKIPPDHWYLFFFLTFFIHNKSSFRRCVCWDVPFFTATEVLVAFMIYQNSSMWRAPSTKSKKHKDTPIFYELLTFRLHNTHVINIFGVLLICLPNCEHTLTSVNYDKKPLCTNLKPWWLLRMLRRILIKSQRDIVQL